MRFALGAMVFFTSCTSCNQAPKPTLAKPNLGLPPDLTARLSAADLDESRFGALCAEAIHVSYPDAGVTALGHLNFQLDHPDIALISFDNPWRTPPDQRAAAVWDQVRSIRAIIDGFDQPGLETQIVPLVRGAFEVPLGLDAGEDSIEGVGAPWVGDLRLVYMFNRPTILTPVTAADLIRLKLTPARQREVALANLRALLPPIEKTQIRNPLADGATEPRIWLVTLPGTGGTFETSLMLLDEVWGEMEKELGNGLVVAVPSRDLLFVTRGDNADDVRKLRAIAADAAHKLDHPISATLFARRKAGWQPLP